MKRRDFIKGLAAMGVAAVLPVSHAANMTSWLDDYEKGTFTPALTDGTNTNSKYHSSSGTYTRRGNIVYVNLKIQTRSTSTVRYTML